MSEKYSTDDLIKHSAVDMLSIRTNENGDFVFDVRIRKPDNSIEIGELVMPCSKENIESIANWHYYNFGFSKHITYRFLQELRELGREKLLEKYPTPKIDDTEDVLERDKDRLWEIIIYKD